jgi:L-asparaginase II
LRFKQAELIVTNPVLVEVLRGSVVESRHRGAVFVCDAGGRGVIEIGDVSRPVFPRSAVKAIQALPLVESGAADAYGFGERELALACASHSGEVAHVELARSMLAGAGLDETALECGGHWPLDHDATVALARTGQVPSSLHNNCSGKHAGFLCTCRHVGLAYQGYVSAGHPHQAMIREAMNDVTGAAHDAGNCAIDGCSIPTYAIPVKNLAAGFARMATGAGLSAGRARAARRLFSACMAEPFLVAGTGRADVALMQAAPGRIFVKTGAEGVYCAAVPELGVGIALKCDDGAGRAAEAMIAAVLAKLLHADEALAAELARQANPAITSRIGAKVGAVRPTGLLS